MNLKIVGTGSSGNCYLLVADNGETLIVEAGLPYKKILKELDFNVKNIVGVLVSHSHLDHSKSANEFKNMGILVFDTYDSKLEKQVRIYGNFTIHSFKLIHDVPCIGFYILHEEIGSMVYLTDTEYCKYRFPKVNHILIEANYDNRMIDANHPAKEHILRGHMELQTTKQFVLANKSNSLQNVILCHMSEKNMNLNVMEQEVKKIAGHRVEVSIAKPGMSLELRRFPF